jgi:hypothetical protein
MLSAQLCRVQKFVLCQRHCCIVPHLPPRAKKLPLAEFFCSTYVEGNVVGTLCHLA